MKRADRYPTQPPKVCDCKTVLHQHGTMSMYRGCRCRCADCRDAAARAARDRYRTRAYGQWRPYTVPVAGSARRLQALMAAGWSLTQVAEFARINPSHLRRILRTDQEYITESKAVAIRRTYDTLWDSPPPETTQYERQRVSRMRGEAKRRGYAPALAWDDDEIDDPKAKPRHRLQRSHGLSAAATDLAERRQQIAELLRVGYEREVIAHLVGVTVRTVERDLAAVRDKQQEAA